MSQGDRESGRDWGRERREGEHKNPEDKEHQRGKGSDPLFPMLDMRHGWKRRLNLIVTDYDWDPC